MFLRQTAASFRRRIGFYFPDLFSSTATAANSLTGRIKFAYRCDHGGFMRKPYYGGPSFWILMSSLHVFGMTSTLALADEVSVNSSLGNDVEGDDAVGLRKVEDDSVVSNTHTIKWRVFTDSGRDLFLKGKLEEAQKLFSSAIQEAREGFGERDPHVASACNNLAELYRVKKEFDNAEPLYIEAVKILEESFGPDDIRVGAALHNLGQLYLVQRKLEEARCCYERALKIKRHVLGHSHIDYADTMYHLGTVLYLQGREKDSEALIQDSIQILEEGGQGDSILCIRRMRYLAQIYLKSNRLADAENIHRKILHAVELSKGWSSLDTVRAAEGLALTLQSAGRLSEAQELLERCLDARKSLLPENHVQIAANMFHIARVMMLNSDHERGDSSESVADFVKAKDYLDNSIRLAQQAVDKLIKQKGCLKNYKRAGEGKSEAHAALIILLQSLDTLARLEIENQELLKLKELSHMFAPGDALFRCISSYKEYGTGRLICDSPKVKVEYLSCLKHLLTLIGDGTTEKSQKTLQELKDEIKRVEAEIPLLERRGSGS